MQPSRSIGTVLVCNIRYSLTRTPTSAEQHIPTGEFVRVNIQFKKIYRNEFALIFLLHILHQDKKWYRNAAASKRKCNKKRIYNRQVTPQPIQSILLSRPATSFTIHHLQLKLHLQPQRIHPLPIKSLCRVYTIHMIKS